MPANKVNNRGCCSWIFPSSKSVESSPRRSVAASSSSSLSSAAAAPAEKPKSSWKEKIGKFFSEVRTFFSDLWDCLKSLNADSISKLFQPSLLLKSSSGNYAKPSSEQVKAKIKQLANDAFQEIVPLGILDIPSKVALTVQIDFKYEIVDYKLLSKNEIQKFLEDVANRWDLISDPIDPLANSRLDIQVLVIKDQKIYEIVGGVYFDAERTNGFRRYEKDILPQQAPFALRTMQRSNLLKNLGSREDALTFLIAGTGLEIDPLQAQQQ